MRRDESGTGEGLWYPACLLVVPVEGYHPHDGHVVNPRSGARLFPRLGALLPAARGAGRQLLIEIVRHRSQLLPHF